MVHDSTEEVVVIEGKPGRMPPVMFSDSLDVQLTDTSGRSANQSATCHTTPTPAG